VNERRILIGLWAAAVLIGVALVVAPSRWWGDNAKPESALAQYIKSVDSIQHQQQQRLTQLLTAYSDFSTQSSDPNALAKLAKPERTLRTLGKRLAALPAPPEARHLQSLLEQFVSDEHAIAVEIQQVAAFMPRFRVLIGDASVARIALVRGLAAAPPVKAHAVHGTPKKIAAARAAYAAAATKAQAQQADAIDAYDNALAATIRDLRKLQPPPVIAPAYRAELLTLSATRMAGADLSAELRKPHSSRVPLLGRRFTEASRISGSVGAQRAEIAAIKSYNARVRGIRTLAGRIRVEEANLQKRSS
jgi:hypothetical protein